MKDFHFDAISAFENYEIEKMRDGHVVVTTKVVDSSVIFSHSVTKAVVWWLSRWGLMG